MTEKEYIEIYLSELSDDDSFAGVNSCPEKWIPSVKSLCDGNKESICNKTRTKCWNQETPEEQPDTQPTDTPTQPQILDSGNRREFETGAKRDISDDKGRFDLLPWAAIMEIAKHCQNGSKKYGEHNVDLGIPTHSLLDSACRHVAKYLDGWTDEPHLIAAAWNLLWAIQMEVKMPEMVDTPWRKEQTDEHES